MRTATLTLTVDFVREIDDKNLAGHGHFDNGKTLDPISFTAYTQRLQDTIVPGVTLVAEGNIRAFKNAAGITSLSLNITQAMQVGVNAKPAEPADAIEAELLDELSPAEIEQPAIEVEPVAPAKPKATRSRKSKVLATV